MTVPPLELAISHVGGVAQLSVATGATPNNIRTWRWRGLVPVGWVPLVSQATGGAVPCHLFDPARFPHTATASVKGEG